MASLLTMMFHAGFSLAQTSPIDPQSDPASDQTVATRLFVEGKKLLDEGHLAEACPKLAESDALDPEVGTKMNLARCYEAVGKTASAYTTWQLAAAAAAKRAAIEEAEADRKKQAAREAYAAGRVEALRARLLHVALRVSEPADAGLQVRLDGESLTRERWDAAVSVDPGMHQVVVTAPAKRAWSKEFEVDEQTGPFVIIIVPSLAPVAVGLETHDADPSSTRSAAIVLGIVGGAGILAGAGFGIAAIVQHNDLSPDCTPSLNCNSEGISKLSAVKTDATLADISFAVGGAALVAGLLLWTLPLHGHTVYVQSGAGPAPAGVSMGGAW